MPKQLAIALDIGGTKIAAALVDTEGRILSSFKVDTPKGTSSDVVDSIAGLVGKLTAPTPETGEVVGIGLGVAGTIDWNQGIIVQSPNLPFSNFGLRNTIESRFGLSTFMDNDANLATLGEKYFGAARGVQHVIGLTLGTGIGAGIIFNGCLYRGATGSAAEIGHMVIQATGPQCTCGSYGCFEEMAAGRTLVRLAKEKAEQNRESLILKLAGGEVKNITGPMVTEAARQDDKTAIDVFSEIGFWLGIGINNVINIFNPELIVLGGGMADAGELILSPIREVVVERTLHPNKDIAGIVLAQLGNQAGVLGAAALVFDELGLARI